MEQTCNLDRGWTPGRSGMSETLSPPRPRAPRRRASRGAITVALTGAALLAPPASARPLIPSSKNACLQVSAGEGATEADAVLIETALERAFLPLLEANGFKLVTSEAIHAELRSKGIPKGAWHAPMNSAANTAIIVRLRELDVELHWMTVLTHDGPWRLALSAMQFHDLENLHTTLVKADSLPELAARLKVEAPQLVKGALDKFKSTPMPSWWRPQAVAAPPAAAPAPARTAAPSRDRLPDGAQVAILDLQHTKAFTVDDARYLTDVVRGAVLAQAPRLSVMTRENLLVLLQASGKDLADCEGECEVDTARRIGVDAVVSGDVLKFGARYKVSLKLHASKSGRLLATAVASGETLEALDTELQQRAAELLAGQR